MSERAGPRIDYLALDLIDRNPGQPRLFDHGEAEEIELAESLKGDGQKVPIVVHGVDVITADKKARRYLVKDGERRVRAARRAGLQKLLAVIYDEQPSEEELRLAPLIIDAHRSGLTPMERSNALARIKAENNWSVAELAAKLSMKQSVCSKLLALQKLDPAIQAMVHHRRIDVERAYIISQTPDPQRQKALADGDKVSRDQLRRQAREDGRPPAAEAKASTVKLLMPGSLAVSLSGKDITLTLAIEVLQETVKQLRKAQTSGYDVSTVQKMLKDQARALQH